MGFWSSFFGAGASYVYNEMKKEEKETQKWNDLFHEMMECESAFNDYLKSVGIIDSYCADVEYVNNGNITSIKCEIENLRKKVNNYISLGGLGVCVRNLGSLDDDIDKVKYLKKVGKLERQVEFAYDDMRIVQDKIEAEQEEIKYQQERLREEQQEQRRQEINNIIGTDINSLSGVGFELICQQLLENMGFETETTKASGDGGIDLIAYNHQPLLSGKYIIQCKRYSGSVGEPIIRDLYGVVTSERANKGILMTTGYFTKSAITFAGEKPIELIDGNKLRELLTNYDIGIAKCDAFFYKMLCTMDINDYENVCMQFIENQDYTIKDVLECNEKNILIKAYDINKGEDVLFVCFQENHNIDAELLYKIINVKTELIKNIIVIGACFNKNDFEQIEDKKIEIVSCEKFLDLLRNQGIIDNDGINLKVGLVSPDKKVILNDIYYFMKDKYLANKNEIKAQLAFIEVLSETASDAWFRNEDEYFLKNLINEYFKVERELETNNKNIQYMLLCIRANLLLLLGEINEAIKSYHKLLEWNMLINSIVYENGLEDMYLAAVYNLYQLLLITDCKDTAGEIYQKHSRIIQYGLGYYREQIEYGVDTDDEEYASEWQRVYDIVCGGKIGEIYVLSGLNRYVISAIHDSVGYRSMIFENFKNIEDVHSNKFIGLDICADIVDLEQKEDGYYVMKRGEMKRWDLCKS